MKIKIIRECGYTEALLGLGLSYGITSEHDVNYFMIDHDLRNRMYGVALKLADKDGGHNKFLETIAVWLDVAGPAYWWIEFDTYRIGVSKQSESTMHTVIRNEIKGFMFEGGLDDVVVERLEKIRLDGDLLRLKRELPMSFIQRRIICLNYKVLRHMIKQRKNHRLPEWKLFCTEILSQIKYPEFINNDVEI
jgi:hypothetical protein